MMAAGMRRRLWVGEAEGCAGLGEAAERGGRVIAKGRSVESQIFPGKYFREIILSFFEFFLSFL